MAKLNSKTFIDALNSRWTNKLCPMCGHNEWNVDNNILELREYSDGALVVGNTPIFPVVAVTCQYCGNTIFVNPIVISSVEE